VPTRSRQVGAGSSKDHAFFTETKPHRPRSECGIPLAPDSEDVDGWVRGLVSHIDWKVFIGSSTSAPAGEANLTWAHAAAQEALRVAPGSESAQLQIERILRKLARLRAGR
jgi:hypothetical protein